MSHLTIFALAAALTAVAPSQAKPSVAADQTSSKAEAGSSHLAVKGCDLGEMYAFSASVCDVELRNDGDVPIHISNIQFAKTDSVKPDALTVAPHSNAYISVSVNTRNELGGTSHSIRFTSDEAIRPKRGADIFTFVVSALDQARPEIDFGVVNTDKPFPEQVLQLSSRDSESFKIVKVAEKPDFLQVSVSPDGRSLTAKLLPNVQWGMQSDFIKLQIDSPRQKEAWVHVKVDVHGDIIPSVNPLDMGLTRYGESKQFLVQLKSRNGNDFQVGKISLEGVVGETKVGICDGQPKGCKTVGLTVSDKQPEGAIMGKLKIAMPDFAHEIPIGVFGVILPKGARVKTIDPEQHTIDGVPMAGTASPTSVAKPTVDLSKSIDSAVKAAAQIAPPGAGPLLKWAVANAAGVYGFQVFRADAEEGPFVLVNTKVIRVPADAGEVGQFQWRDQSATTGKTYWYYIGMVKNDGSKQQLSGAQKVVAK